VDEFTGRLLEIHLKMVSLNKKEVNFFYIVFYGLIHAMTEIFLPKHSFEKASALPLFS
jgi:hypothetical protein